MIDIDEDKFWDEMIAEAKREAENPPPNSKTRKQFKEETGMTEWQVKYFLQYKIDNGELQVIKLKGILYYYPA